MGSDVEQRRVARPALGPLRLADVREATVDGFGLQPTWPAAAPWLGVPIDHVLASPSIGIRRREVGPDVGSDHRGVMVEFAMPR